jgi:hypothetical protein
MSVSVKDKLSGVVLPCGSSMEGNMLELEAGRHPHVITRPCRDRDDAERWARELTSRGFIPVMIDGVVYRPLVDESVTA